MMRAAFLCLTFGSIALLAACGGEPTPPATSPAADSSDAPPRPAGKRAPCVLGKDETCNADPSVSAIWGTCQEGGVCECKPGFELAPSGYCQPASKQPASELPGGVQPASE